MRKLAPLPLLATLLALTAAQAEAAPLSQPVLVEFDGLLWIQSAEGMPYLKNGQILAPMTALCDLFGAKCKPDWAKKTFSVKQEGQAIRFPSMPIEEIRWQGGRKVGFVSLKKMGGPLGYAPPRWLPDAHRVNVQRVGKVAGGLSGIQGDVAGLNLKPTRLNAPAVVQMRPLKGSSSMQELLLSSPSRDLGRIWQFYPHARMGAITCTGKSMRVCRTSHDPDWFYTLAYVELVDVTRK